MPIIDSGEHGGFWVLVMPRAEKSLREHLDAGGGRLELAETLEVLVDVSEALVSLEGRVVHRDLKPENVLLFDSRWCLADFGIARYAEASTAPDTHKFALSPPYAAPERWRYETATSATDVYSVGVIAFEMSAGELPFSGPTLEDFRDQHLHASPPSVEAAPAPFAALVDECMFKAPGARPTPSSLWARLGRIPSTPTSGGLAALAEASRAAASRMGEEARVQSEQQTAAERRSALASAGRATFFRISESLSSAIRATAPAAVSRPGPGGGWTITLNEAALALSPPTDHRRNDWGGWEPPSFDVILSASLSLRIPQGRTQYEGRSHSLWYCDAKTEGEFAWCETAFMISPMIPKRGRQNPFALDPGEQAAKAVWTGMAEFQVAWPFTPIVVDNLDEFIDRWGAWLADAAQGQLGHPSQMPERNGCQESYRHS